MINADNSLYILGLFSYAMLMAGCIVWTGIGISWWLEDRNHHELTFAIGMLASAVMFACLTLVVAAPPWLATGALVPLTRIVAAIAVVTLGDATTAYMRKTTSIKHKNADK